ncbi:hypothetical protein PHET_00207 [Paragonimus heterotremus]|uniref:Uncharacterized protein n=1 Tax=Paragonimus heterotremus TaxID=100268 RepID=A0A8J4TNY5_9TREM|nr:hypothetical protein PHET_00207 [Paragonimus heterotremus]
MSSFQIAAMESMKEMSAYFQQSELDDIILPNIQDAYTVTQPQSELNRTVLKSLGLLLRQISTGALQHRLIPFLLETCATYTPDTKNAQTGQHETDPSADTHNPIVAICGLWKDILTMRSNAIDAQLVTRRIFPTILPNVHNPELTLSEFRIVMSTLYALLDTLDVSVGGSDASIEATQYRVIPAVTVHAPNSNEYRSSCDDDLSTTGLTIDQDVSSTPRRSFARDAVPFVPMLHPKQLRELEKSPSLARRASAHVIFPLPSAQENESITIPNQSECISLGEKSPSPSSSFFGLRLPSITNLRRHSCDMLKPNTINESVNPNVHVYGSRESVDTRRGSSGAGDHITHTDLTVSKSIDQSDRTDSNLLTARVCEGPFISAPSSRAGSRRASGARVSDWALDPMPMNLQRTQGSPRASKQLLTADLGAIPSSRRSSFNALGDTVVSIRILYESAYRYK